MGETDELEVKQKTLEKLLEAKPSPLDRLLEAIKSRKGPLLVIRVPLLGSVSAMFISHFSGNGILWNILHFCLSWYYVAYKLAKLIFGS